MEDKDLKAEILYLCREKYYDAMQAEALDGVRRFPSDPSFRLYNGLALLMARRVQDSIRELAPLQSDREAALASALLLMQAHRRCATVDREAVAQLDAKVKEERKRAGEAALCHAAAALLYCGKADKARDYVDKLMKTNPKYLDGLVMKGWIELYAGRDTRDGRAKDAIHYFDTALELSAGKKNMDAMFGKVRYCELQSDYDGAIALLNQLIVRYPSLTPPLIEKMKNQLALLDWEQAAETSSRILSVDVHCLEALKAKVLTTMCRDGNYEDACLALRRLYTDMEKMEPKNCDLFLETAQLFSRVCGRHASVLTETYRFAEKAAQLDPTSADLLTELGYQYLLQGRIKDATKLYRNATKIDDSSVSALLGLTKCQLAEGGASEQAAQQVEFLREVQGSQPSPDLLFMCAQLAAGQPQQAINYLNDAVDSHFRALRLLPYGPKYLRCLDPDFLLQVVKEYLAYAPVQPALNVNKYGGASCVTQSHSLPVPLKQSLTILEAITKACPGLLEGLYQLARVHFLSGDHKAAALTLQHILDDVDAAAADANLLMAQIHVHQGDFQKAAQTLEVGLSYNFKVRDHPLYHLISALVHKYEGKLQECIRILQTAMEVAGLKPGAKTPNSAPELSLPDKVSVFLELAGAYREANQMTDAVRVMQDAIDLFAGTSEESRVTVANAELMLYRGDTRLALELLQSVSPNHTYYQQARCRMADIHLRYRKDRRAFAECFRELVEKAPGPLSYVMLGDAYMSIQEPESAIDAYEQALKRNPRDAALASKMGRALVKTHQYGKAINYYKEAVKSESNSELKLDMAELYMKLGQYDKAEKTLTQEVDAKADANDVASLVARTKLLLLLARVRDKAGDAHQALETLKEARGNQSRVLKRSAVDAASSASSNAEQRQLAASICSLMAEHACALRDYTAAISMYKEALILTPDDRDTLVCLARLYMQVNDLDQCQLTCTALLKSDADNDAATVMMADLAFRRMDLDTAAFHFQQLLARRPDYWTALARLVEVMRRTGCLEEVPPYLARAEATSGASGAAGLCYCRGLYLWYSGNTSDALRQFSAARYDTEWGRQAIHNMIDICLNPDDDTLSGDVFVDYDDDYSRDSHEMALRTAERLLKELKPRPGAGVGGAGGGVSGGDEALTHRLLSNFFLLATRQKGNVERALQDLTSLVSIDTYRDHVGTALGLATAYMMLKQTPRARNQLKRVAKTTWSFEDAEYLERCWLLLADIYIQAGKCELAGDLLRRVLQHNRACTRAYEYAGHVAEKEQAYRDAATQYERAWHFGGRSNPVIGYKLAFNYMKGKRYADAIDVCQQVLKVQPDYPRIRKEILDKCKNNIRS